MASPLSLPFFGIILMLTLTACSGGGGSGDDDDDELFTGQFIDSEVEGLRYETPSRSGMTNAAGEFQYLSGETVTFSIGGITLGSTAGDAIITPFDLFDISIPTTDEEIIAIINDSQSIGAFDRAANVVNLLIFLDLDGDPDNGIDLSGLDEVLADATFSFERQWYSSDSDFIELGRQFGLATRGNFDPSANLEHLFASNGVIIQARALSRIEIDDDNDGNAESVETYTYNDTGRYTGEAYDDDADGNFEEVIEYVYDDNGVFDLERIHYDDDDDGVVDRIRTEDSTYDDAGRFLSRVSEERAGTTLLSSFSFSRTYDSAGNTIMTERNRDSDGDGDNDSVEIETNTFDINGNQLTEDTIEIDGSSEQRDFEENTYDSNNNRVTRTFRRDFTNDGTFDYREVTESTYDSAGNVLTEIRSRDNDNDGNFDAVDTSTYTYDDNGNELTLFEERDFDASGAANRTKQVTSTFDSDDNRISQEEIIDTNADGSPDSIEIRTQTFDDAGRLLTRRVDDDFGADSSIDEYTLFEETYDDLGNQLTSRTQSFIVDTLDRASMVQYTYVDNYLTMYLIQQDDDGDGTIDSESSETYSYVTIDNGLYYLLENF